MWSSDRSAHLEGARLVARLDAARLEPRHDVGHRGGRLAELLEVVVVLRDLAVALELLVNLRRFRRVAGFSGDGNHLLRGIEDG